MQGTGTWWHCVNREHRHPLTGPAAATLADGRLAETASRACRRGLFFKLSQISECLGPVLGFLEVGN